MASNSGVATEFVAGLSNALYRRLEKVSQVISDPDLNRKVDSSNKDYKEPSAVHYNF